MMRVRRSRLLPRVLWLGSWLASTLSTRLAGRFAAALWFVPWQDRRPPAAVVGCCAGSATSVAVDVGGTRLRGYEAGQGPTVLLVHGWADRAASLCAFVEPLAAAGFRVVAVDLPAHGASPGYRVDGYVLSRTIHRLVDDLSADVLVAHSLGALAAIRALGDGLDLRGAVLLAPSVRLEHALVSFAALARLPGRAVAGLRRVIERRFGVAVWREFAADLHAPGLDLPALIVHDRDDRQVPIDDARALAAAWPAARLVETSGLGHRRLLRDADVVALVTAFMDDLDWARRQAAG